MVVWVAVCQDRHLDAEVFVCLTREGAIKKAKEYMKEHVSNPRGLRYADTPERYIIYYKYEDDTAFVVKTEITAEVRNVRRKKA